MTPKPKDFIEIQARVPASMCVYFHADGTKTVHCGKTINRKLVLHVRKPK